MYPLGVLFGLGFDTASEVALLFLAAGAARGRAAVVRDPLPAGPVRRRACRCSTRIDGSFMNFAYGWAFSQPVRKVFYNLTVTGLSVAVALVIGTIELLSIAVERLDLSGGFWGWVAGIDLNAVGYVVVGLFVATWALALAVWRFGHIEDRWAPSRASASSSGRQARRVNTRGDPLLRVVRNSTQNAPCGWGDRPGGSLVTVSVTSRLRCRRRQPLPPSPPSAQRPAPLDRAAPAAPGAVRLRPTAERRGARGRRRRRLGLSQPRGPRGPRPRPPRPPRPRARALPAGRPPARVRPVRELRGGLAARAGRARRACARRCSTPSATGRASRTSRSPACARPARRRRTHADAHPRRADARPSGRGRAAWPPRSSACTSSASACSSGSSSRTTSASAPAAPSPPASGSRPTRWACATPSTPTTSRPSTTPRASSCRRASGRSASASSSRSGTRPSSSCWRCCSRSASRRWPARSQDGGSTLHSVTGLIGTGVSGTFLYVIAALNLVVLVGHRARLPRHAPRGLLPRTSSRTCCSRAGS